MGKHNTAYYTTQKLRMRFEIRKYECDISEEVERKEGHMTAVKELHFPLSVYP